jgi:hypothetical protein
MAKVARALKWPEQSYASGELEKTARDKNDKKEI